MILMGFGFGAGRRQDRFESSQRPSVTDQTWPSAAARLILHMRLICPHNFNLQSQRLSAIPAHVSSRLGRRRSQATDLAH